MSHKGGGVQTSFPQIALWLKACTRTLEIVTQAASGTSSSVLVHALSHNSICVGAQKLPDLNLKRREAVCVGIARQFSIVGTLRVPRYVHRPQGGELHPFDADGSR